MIKKYIYSLLVLMFVNGCLCADDAVWILKKMDAVRDYKTSKIAADMKIVDRNGRETVMSLVSSEENNPLGHDDKSLMRFTGPPRLKGTAILTLGDNIWYYNNRTNRVRLLSRSAKKGSMMGSSFSYEDMTQDFVNDFTALIEKETKNEYVIRMIPKDSGKTYKYLLTTVQKDTFIATETGYYNKNDLLYKKMTAGSITRISGHLIALEMGMTDIGSQKTTYFIIEKASAEFDLEFEDKLFSERFLKK